MGNYSVGNPPVAATLSIAKVALHNCIARSSDVRGYKLITEFVTCYTGRFSCLSCAPIQSPQTGI